MIYSIKLTHESTVGKVLHNGSDCFYDPDVYFNCSRCKNNQSESGRTQRKTNQPRERNNKNEKEEKESSSDAEHVCDRKAGEYSFVPFGKGSRMCAGKNYGMLFLRIMLFQLVRTTDIKLSSKVSYSAVPMTKPHKSVTVKFEKLGQHT